MSHARRKLKRAIAEIREQRRQERHAERFLPILYVSDVNNAEDAVTFGTTRNEYQKKKAHDREQRFYKRKRHREMRMADTVADGGLYLLLCRCRGWKKWAGRAMQQERKTPYWYRDGNRVTA